jgi:hypothetical protein
LTIWTDLDSTREADFHEWYDREHLQERADVPGFVNARRYRSMAGPPAFFAAYDTESLAALSAPEYQKALANQTGWSKRVFTGFRNTVRVTSEVVSTAGHGYGGWLIALRCMPLPGLAKPLRKALSGDFAATLHKTPGVVRVTAAIGTVAALEVFGTGACDPAEPTRAVLIVEASDPAALTAMNQGVLSDVELERLGAGPPDSRSIYTLQHVIVS